MHGGRVLATARRAHSYAELHQRGATLFLVPAGHSEELTDTTATATTNGGDEGGAGGGGGVPVSAVRQAQLHTYMAFDERFVFVEPLQSLPQATSVRLRILDARCGLCACVLLLFRLKHLLTSHFALTMPCTLNSSHSGDVVASRRLPLWVRVARCALSRCRVSHRHYSCSLSFAHTP